jgi:hypothetical protein
MLDDLEEFLAACRSDFDFMSDYNPLDRITAGDLYCGQCGGPRRVRIVRLWSRAIEGGGGGLSFGQHDSPIAEQMTPSLFHLNCVQCDAAFEAVIYRGPQGPALAILPDHYGGLSTPHTPPEVAYYLDQAHRSRSVGANSAAVAMFRSALEFILYKAGYEKKMLGPKIGQLEEAIKDGSAPKWARDLDTNFLKIIKRLGDGGIHPNDGKIEAQAALDTALLIALDVTFAELIFSIYEQEHDKGERLATLTAALDVLDGKAAPATPGATGS